jgi:hypothetical protein
LAGIHISTGTTISQKNHSSKGVGMEMSLFCVDLMWNAPETLSTTTVTDLFSLIIFFDLFQLFLKGFQ